MAAVTMARVDNAPPLLPVLVTMVTVYNYYSVAPHTSQPTTIFIAPRRPSRFQVVHFSKATAALFLKQTESLWMKLDLTRSEGEGCVYPATDT